MNIGKTIMTLTLSALLTFAPVAEKQEKPIDIDSIHSRTGIIYNVDYDNDIVYIVDIVDHVWVFSGTEDWIEGDIISFTLWDSNNTPDSIWDDEIISIGYSGWTLEEWQTNYMLDYIAEHN